ncbi:MAG: imidazolonepropionase [Bdellovibrionales bacterium]|nr:imidazolonepropionase [Bdellovibrionales bacterium]
MKKAPSRPPILISGSDEIVTLQAAAERQGRGAMGETALSVIKKSALLIQDGIIKWVGNKKKLPREFRKAKEISVSGNLFPGFIDCHTHTIFHGNRAHEFEMRNRGVTYQEIAHQGGGIAFTVKQTRGASDADLKRSLISRLDYFIKQGVTTVEIKSGYGLSPSSEIRLLKILKSTKHSVEIVPTYLGAHSIPPEYKDAKSYISHVKNQLSEIKSKKLAERVDIFVEKGYFSKELAEDYLHFAKDLGFKITVHADQLSLSGGAEIAVAVDAVSADHLIRVEEAQIKKLSQSETTCVLLPAADFYTHCPYPPARKMLEHNCRIALASDFNPGTSPTQNLQFVGLLARTMMQMSLPEVFTAMTVGAAHALSQQDRLGSLTENKQADFFVSERSWDQFFYDLSPTPIKTVWKRGVPLKTI